MIVSQLFMLRELLNEINKDRFREYIYGFTRNLKQSFVGSIKWPRTLLHILAILISIPLVILAVDWHYFLFFRYHLWLQIFLAPAVFLGSWVPLLLPPTLYLIGKKDNRKYLIPLAFALTQAGVVALFWTAFYKTFTGRNGPELRKKFHGDYSTKFSFGILRGGVFEGWPSSHAAIICSMAIVYYYYLPVLIQRDSGEPDEFDLSLLRSRKYGLILAAYVGFCVSTNIHWLSDALAGILVGISVGMATWRNFSETWNEELLSEKSQNRVIIIACILFVIILFSFIKINY